MKNTVQFGIEQLHIRERGKDMTGMKRMINKNKNEQMFQNEWKKKVICMPSFEIVQSLALASKKLSKNGIKWQKDDEIFEFYNDMIKIMIYSNKCT